MPYAGTDRTRIYYERGGKGPAVVLVTGFAGTCSFWSRVVPMLSDSFDVITPDNRGCGRTFGEGGMTVQDLADDIIGLMDALGIEKAHLAGWSMGSHVAICAASQHPDRFRTLTAIGSYAARPARASYILNHLAQAYLDGEASASVVGEVMNVLLHTEGFFESAAETGRPVREAEVPPPDMFAEQLRGATVFDASEAASKVRVPSLVIHGTEDVMTPVAQGRAVASLIPGCRMLELPSEGHIIRPQAYVPELRRFLSEHRA